MSGRIEEIISGNVDAMGPKRKQSIQGVLFDWDGTLLNSYEADSAAYLAMFREMGIPWGLEDLARHYSPNWYHVYRAAKLPQARWDDADRAWRAQYAKHKPRLLAGALWVLNQLRTRHELGLVTSGDRDRVVRQLREFRLTQVFSASVCSGDTSRKKPHPEPLRLALRQMELDPGTCVYVGDSAEDLEMARRAGVRAIAVLGPFPTEKRLRAARPELLLESIEELPGALESLRG
jgi:HAD superfamily hydrolase (TIGR01549 family)